MFGIFKLSVDLLAACFPLYWVVASRRANWQGWSLRKPEHHQINFYVRDPLEEFRRKLNETFLEKSKKKPRFCYLGGKPKGKIKNHVDLENSLEMKKILFGKPEKFNYIHSKASVF